MSEEKKDNTLLIMAIVGSLFVLTTSLLTFLSSPRGAALRDEVISIQQVLHDGIVVGTVGSNEEEEIEEFKPFARYLASELGIQDAEASVVVTESVLEMAKKLRLGEVDIYIDSPVMTYIADELSGSHPIANRWKKGMEKYNSVLFVRADGNLYSIHDLAGFVVAFEEVNSTSGHYLPKGMLLQQGLSLVEMENKNDNHSLASTAYFFSGNTAMVYQDVLLGIADVGAINEAELRELAGKNFDKIRIIGSSPEIYRHILTVSSNFDVSHHRELEGILLEMSNTTDGRAALKDFGNTTKFGIFPNGAIDAYEGISELVNLVLPEVVF